MSPHGSFEYSGSIAAQAWQAASAREVGTIVIISPSHRKFERGIFLPECREFRIPVGTFNVDRDLVKGLMHCGTFIREDDIPHLEEHAIEVQLPFADRFFPDAHLLPLIVSGVEDASLDSLFTNLQFLLGERGGDTLFVLTSNLAVNADKDICMERSAAFMAALERQEPAKVKQFIDGSASFCGARIIAAFMRSTFASGTRVVNLGIDCSASLAEPGEPIVGYGAAGFTR
jgi:AmmeMemoRadiSam system protein B